MPLISNITGTVDVAVDDVADLTNVLYVPTPVISQRGYVANTDEWYYYDGTNWVPFPGGGGAAGLQGYASLLHGGGGGPTFTSPGLGLFQLINGYSYELPTPAQATNDMTTGEITLLNTGTWNIEFSYVVQDQSAVLAYRIVSVEMFLNGTPSGLSAATIMHPNESPVGGASFATGDSSFLSPGDVLDIRIAQFSGPLGTYTLQSTGLRVTRLD